MRSINIIGEVTAVGVGGLDKFLATKDEEAGRVGFGKSWSKWFQIAAVAAGLAGQIFNIKSKYADPVAVAGTTLLTQSVWDAVRSRAPAEAAVTRARGFSAIRRPISQTAGPGFDKVQPLY